MKSFCGGLAHALWLILRMLLWLAVYALVGAGILLVILVIALARGGIGNPLDRDEGFLRRLHDRLRDRLAVDYVVLRAKIDLWLARRARR